MPQVLLERRRSGAADRGAGAASVERVAVGERVTMFRTPKSRKWYMQYQLNGKQYRPSLKVESKKKALALAQKKEAELLLGVARPPTVAAPVIASVVKTYLASLRDRGRSVATLHVYERYLRQFQAYCDDRGVRRLTDLSTDLLEGYQRRLAEQGYPVRDGEGDSAFPDRPNKPRTVRSKMKTIRQVIRFALKRQSITADPAPGYYLPAAVKAQAYCWTGAELKAIFDHLDPDVAVLFHFLRMTGLRSNELCWLTKADLDVDHAHVKVRAKTCPQTGTRWSPKHGNERSVPLSREALAIARKAAEASPGPWLFYAPGTGRKRPGHWHLARVWRVLKAAMRSAGVTKGTVHTFRHVFCSFLANNRASGITPFQVMRVMGHSSMDIVLQYFHVSDKEMADAMGSLSFAAMLVDGKEEPTKK
jgi:site-specific recombinase XerD